MKEILRNLVNNTQSCNNTFKPKLFFLNNASDAVALPTLLNEQLFVTDDIENQLKELIRTRHPDRRLSAEENHLLVAAHLGDTPLHEYGVWVYYPWSKRLVHLLPENEFIELRTSRNKYKITDEEEQILAQKKIGVVGLSVGQAVSLTLSIERGMGELRIADFDTLELTNMNRIRTGVHNLGLHKTIIVAREIAEIDPFLKVVPFTEGLTRENMDQFFTEGGTLDLIIDECDGLDIKILLRQKAKSLRIPVLMEASDRGTVDVERYDLEPERPLLHGFIDHLNPDNIGTLSNEEKLPFILPMLGLETISARLKASMLEIGYTVTTWPQLASAVALGGAICADVSRRILLDQFHESGRYFVDTEELISDKPSIEPINPVENDVSYTGEQNSAAKIEPIEDALIRDSELTDDDLVEIVTSAMYAPSEGNTQPWFWVSKKGNLFLYHDRTRSGPWLNPNNTVANLAFGAALENVRLKSQTLGYDASIVVQASNKCTNLVATVSFHKTNLPASNEVAHLAAQIPLRHTNRKAGNMGPLDMRLLQQIIHDVAAPPGMLTFTDDLACIKKIANIVALAEGLLLLEPAGHDEVYRNKVIWQKNSDEDAGKGIQSQGLELSIRDEINLRIAEKTEVVSLLSEWNQGTALKTMNLESLECSGAFGMIVAASYDAADMIQAGSLLERLWLSTTGLELALHPVCAPLYLYHKIALDSDHGIRTDNIELIKQMHEQLSLIFPALKANQGAFLFRLSVAAKPATRTGRRPLSEMYTPL